MITLRLERDQVTPHLRKLLKESETNSPLGRVLGRAASNELKKHFRERNKIGNKLGGKRTNFWSRVAESVQSPVPKPGEIVIPVSHPDIAQKVFGGTIRPRTRKHLAIPISPKAHDKSPCVFSNLQFATTKAGVKLLGLKDGDGGVEWLYVLKKKVTQSPDPKALPEDSKVVAAMTKAGDIYLRKRK